MEVSSAVTVILLAIGSTSVLGAHFRGGTMNWKPTGNPNEVEVFFDMGFNGFRGPNEAPPSGHYRCSEAAKQDGRLLGTRGDLECRGCAGFSWKPMEWRCTDFDIAGGWDIGGDSITLSVRDVNVPAVVYFNRCCWVGPLVNAPLYHDSQGWKMMTEIDLRPRPDNGLINSSPITSPIPVQLFHSGCSYHLEIPVTDPDNDAYRCRYTRSTGDEHDECYDNLGQYSKYEDICNKLNYVTVYDNCTLVFDTSGGPGYYAVRVMIEDLDANGDPLSKVSLSFLLEVAPDDTTCKTPTIISPPSVCKTIPYGELYEETVVAEAATADLLIKRIETSKPTGMTVSELQDIPGESLRKSVHLSWTPTADQIGRHSLGFNAVDKDGFSSGWSWVTLNVAAGHLLHPVAHESNPSDGAEVLSTSGWTVKFNRPIQRPSHSAYITLKDQAGVVMVSLDASQEQEVAFSEDEVTFNVVLGTDVFGKNTFYLDIDGGVAIDKEVADCSIFSSPAKWPVIIQGAEKPVTESPPTAFVTIPPITKPPIHKCTPGNVDIAPPENTKDGEECFIHLEDSTFIVSENSINVPYKLCCPSSCEQTGPPGPPGPPGCV